MSARNDRQIVDSVGSLRLHGASKEARSWLQRERQISFAADEFMFHTLALVVHQAQARLWTSISKLLQRKAQVFEHHSRTRQKRDRLRKFATAFAEQLECRIQARQNRLQ